MSWNRTDVMIALAFSAVVAVVGLVIHVPIWIAEAQQAAVDARAPKFSLLVHATGAHGRFVDRTDLTQEKCEQEAQTFRYNVGRDDVATCEPMREGDSAIAGTLQGNSPAPVTEAGRRRMIEDQLPGLRYARDAEAKATTAIQNYDFHRQNVRDCAAGSPDCELPDWP